MRRENKYIKNSKYNKSSFSNQIIKQMLLTTRKGGMKDRPQKQQNFFHNK